MKLKTSPSGLSGHLVKEEPRDSRADNSESASQSPDLSPHCGTAGLQSKTSTDLGPLGDKRGSTHSPSISASSASSPTQCQFAGVGVGVPFSQSCALGGGIAGGGGSGNGGGASGEGQVYYPHHPGVGRMSSSFLPVSSASMSGSPLLHTSMNPLHSSQSAAPCRLTGQSAGGLPDCSSLRQASALSSSTTYGGLRAGGSQAPHPSLSSCTYMQTPQPYAAHLTSNMHMMNMNFSGHMA